MPHVYGRNNQHGHRTWDMGHGIERLTQRYLGNQPGDTTLLIVETGVQDVNG